MTSFILLRTLSNFLILAGLTIVLLDFGPLWLQMVWFRIQKVKGVEYTLEKAGAIPESRITPFGLLIKKYPPIKVEPSSKDFGIVIEKIGVNAPIVPEVDVGSFRRYFEALKSGVAHAAGTSKPGEAGNVYLFAHSALDFWNFGKYAKVFTLLSQVEKGDRVVLFYQGRRYDYLVVSREIFKGFDLTPLLRTYAEPMLTLQTCDPPGTAFNRLVVTAKLVGEGISISTQ